MKKKNTKPHDRLLTNDVCDDFVVVIIETDTFSAKSGKILFISRERILFVYLFIYFWYRILIKRIFQSFAHHRHCSLEHVIDI